MLDELTLWSKKLKDGSDIAHNFHFENSEALPKNIKRIIFVGMGGSGIAGRIMKTFLDRKSTIPSHVIDSEEIPNFVDTETLAIVISYSGNTWETVTALKTLAEKFIPTIVMSHGGKVLEIAESKNIPFILLPKSVQPRAGLGNFLGILLNLLDLMNIVNGKEIYESFLKQADTYVPKFEDKAYFNDFFDVLGNYDFFYIWGISNDSAAFAYRAQTQFNENSKIPVVYSDFPECCHNLICGFENTTKKPLIMVFYSDFLSTNLDNALTATHEVLKEHGAVLYKPPVLGDNWEEQLCHIILWSDFASYYLGKKRGVEVTQVKIIEDLKARHKSKGVK